MSEYQYYEFRKIDSSLSDRAMEEISALSSRAHVSRNSASFTYHYGDFPADPIKVLMRHFDALFYMANWGSRRLAFRFPVSAIDWKAFQRFALGETISIEQKNVHVIVDLWFEDEGLHEWVDGEGTLDRILGLYDDLLDADYRPLFLSCCERRFWSMDGNPMPPSRRYLPACENFRSGIGRSSNYLTLIRTWWPRRHRSAIRSDKRPTRSWHKRSSRCLPSSRLVF